ncbi:retropepsin-like aspartic protease family protein [Tellurirhabdus rosea]|uniref:retropepsin-like aspartic protease family protein n=1 Tax=Tellurirhabdus rosea TaxID=2674997 RepID=UPI0022583878|nr:retropepsin-like aspartic protease [Tellurirhabdus rosea]
MRTTLYLLLITLFLTDCAGCSKSGGQRPPRRRATNDQSVRTPAQEPDRQPQTDETELTDDGSGPTEVKMIKHRGVFKIPATVNGVRMDFILDTGASLISISETEAQFLYKQGTLSDSDFVGKVDFQDANGDISPGMVVRLRTVKIGDRTLRNVDASIVSGSRAPLLLGQSVLAKFGRVSIDYQRNVVIFE